MPRSGCILLVEDDPDDVFLLQYAFEKVELCYPISIAGDGQKAVDYLTGSGEYADRKQFPAPTLVLLDLNLPVLPGMEVLKQISHNPKLSSLPVVVLTSSRNPEDIEESYRLGAQAFLVKPISNEQRERIAKLIKRHWVEGKPRHAVRRNEENPADPELIVFMAAERGQPRPPLALRSD